jgi:hypothetical protein
MAAPNILSNPTVTPFTFGGSLTSTSVTSAVANAAASGTSVKVKALRISNRGAATASITVEIYDGASSYYSAYQVPVPINASYDVYDTSFHQTLAEGWSVRLTAGTANIFHYTGDGETWA